MDFWKNAGIAVKATSGDEMAKLVAAIEAMTYAGYAEALYEAQQLLAELGYAQAMTLVKATAGASTGASIDIGFDVEPTWALQRLQSESSDLALRVVGREQDALRSVVNDALLNGWTVEQTTDAISNAFAEGYHLDGDRHMATDAWSTMVARTELSRASNLGAFDVYRQASVQQVQWLAANGENTCEECGDADGSVVNLGDEFPDVDVDAPPAHPACACVTTPADEDLGSNVGSIDDDELRKTAARGGYSADDFKAKFGFTHPVDEDDDD